MSRFARKKDANQNPIVDMLVDAGYSVQDMSTVGGGLTDLLVGGIDRNTGEPRNWLFEVKTAKGKLNPLQVQWHAAWRGPVHVIRTIDEAYAILGVTR